ncbi:MAG TPA: META domain-containing protein [Candidatus Paceibacterota bacterium]|nr:META domain-containing protein [Candidatus Paceibacterota bacterium]
MGKRIIIIILVVVVIGLGVVLLGKKNTPSPAPAAAPVLGTWVWMSTDASDGSTITPKQASAFTVTFTDDGRVSGTTDCNNFTGSYTQPALGEIAFGALASTKKFCADSQESVFTGALAKANAYAVSFTALDLSFDAGTMHFIKQ